MAGTLCLSGAVLVKAGANVSTYFSTASTAEARIVPLINQAESYLNNVSRYDWVANYSGLSANDKLILEEAASNLAAIYAISYDMSGYTSRLEVQTMLDILWNRINQIVDLLNKKAQDYLQ